MTDKIIINTISKIHFTLISFFIFVIFILSVGFFILQEGVAFKKLNLLNIKIEQLYIKWDEKLSISAQKITVIPKKHEEKELDLQAIDEKIKNLRLFENWIKKITFGNITYGENVFTLAYRENETGSFTAATKNFDLNSSFLLHEGSLRLTLHSLIHRHAMISGTLSMQKGLHHLQADLLVSVENTPLFDLALHTDTKKINYSLRARQKIENFHRLIALFPLPKEVHYWVHDAIELSNLELLDCSGFIPYETPQEAYKYLHAKALAHDLNYTYDTDLDSVRTRSTELEFKNGILFIRPRDAHSYGFDLQESRLQIDFTQPQEVLTLFLAFEGSLNKDVLKILNNYRVKIPFEQNKGTTTADLTLAVNLHTIDIEASGNFTAQNGNFNFYDLNFDVAHAKVFLHNTDVNITATGTKHYDIAAADIQANIDVKQNAGEVALDFKEITLSEKKISLDKKHPFRALYTLANGNDTLTLSPSFWRVAGFDVAVGSSTIPVDFTNLEAVFPKTRIKVPDKASFEISGKGSLKNKELSLAINVLDFSHDTARLAQKNTPLELHYGNDTLEIAAKRDTLFTIYNQKLRLSKTKLRLKNKQLSLLGLDVTLDKLVELRLGGIYDFATKRGDIIIDKALVKREDASPLFSAIQPLHITLKNEPERMVCELESLGIDASYGVQGWHVRFLELQKLAPFTPLFQDYNVTNGTLSLSKEDAKEQIDFSAQTRYPFTLLHAKKEPVKNYRIQGSYTPKDGSVRFNVNDSLFVLFKKELAISAKNIGIDLFELIRFLELFQTGKKQNSLSVLFEGEDTYLYLNKERRIVADTIHFLHNQNGIEATLTCDKGVAQLSYDAQKQFLLHGANFGDRFMEQLFAYSKFQDANLSFTLNGDIDDFEGVFYLKDSTIKDYRILNNILAFVNTIPSLVTFSLPGYSTEGMYVTNGYMKFHAKDLLFDISDILLESKEITILGKGIVDYKKNNVDLELNLKTDLGSSASQIPILGYILFDEKSVATTLSVEGTLEDPQVSSLLAKEIMVAPLNIIKRTFLLPFHLFGDDENEEKK